MSNKFPKPLKGGDKVIILSTARKITKKELTIAEKKLTGWGLKVVYGKNIFKEDHQMAGSDEERIIDFQNALDDKTTKAIICARGGYGSVRIVNQLNFNLFLKNPKWLVGYSDVTVLHNALARKKINIPSLHSSMPINFPTNTKQALETLKQALFGEGLRYKVAHHKLNRTGKAEGKLVGGNLSVLYSLQGTKFEIDTRGKILFIEDIDEYLYHIDRMMINFKLSGKLKMLKGLIVGGFSQIKDNAIPFGKTAEEIIYDAVKEYNYPVCFNFPAGHLDDNRALYLNTEARLEVNKCSHLAFGNLN